MENLIAVFRELMFLKRSNVIYYNTNGDHVLIERLFAFEIPRINEELEYEGEVYEVKEILHNRDDKSIEVYLKEV